MASCSCIDPCPVVFIVVAQQLGPIIMAAAERFCTPSLSRGSKRFLFEFLAMLDANDLDVLGITKRWMGFHGECRKLMQQPPNCEEAASTVVPAPGQAGVDAGPFAPAYCFNYP